MTRRLRAGTLWPAIAARTADALASGALQPITTHEEWVEEAGARFVVRVLGRQEVRDRHTERLRRAKVDPFADPEPALVVSEVSDTHVCVLNKFPILSRHALVVTRAFAEQQGELDASDFAAVALCLAEAPALVFYNGGERAGSTQPHRHFQLVPAPVGAGPQTLATEALFAAGALPFRCIAERCDGVDAAQVLARYRAQRRALALDGRAYNLLVTREWLITIPRVHAHWHGAPVNALGYAGSLLARHQQDLDRLHSAGPLAMLTEVAEPLRELR